MDVLNKKKNFFINYFFFNFFCKIFFLFENFIKRKESKFDYFYFKKKKYFNITLILRPEKFL
jgi:hypothetical protein